MKIKKIKNFIRFLTEYERDLLYLNAERIKYKYTNLEIDQIETDKTELLKEIENLFKE